MSDILSKRTQQGMFEALASQNRAAGSGGGTGYSPFFVLANYTTGVISQAITLNTAVAVTSSSATFAIPRACSVRLSTQVLSAVTAGTDILHVWIVLDSAIQVPAIIWGSGAGTTPYALLSTEVITATLQSGTHTIALNALIGAGGTTTGTITQAWIQVVQLGG